jgi:hypothetical protein
MTHLFQLEKKTNVGRFSFFQKKEQVGKAWIFGSLTNDYHQVSKNWFSRISVILKKKLKGPIKEPPLNP